MTAGRTSAGRTSNDREQFHGSHGGLCSNYTLNRSKGPEQSTPELVEQTKDPVSLSTRVASADDASEAN